MVRHAVNAGLTLLLALLLAGCAGVAPTPQIITITAPPAVTVTVTSEPTPMPTTAPSATHTLTGTLTLAVSVANYGSAPKSCEGSGGYADIAAGAAVTVKDEAGVLIGLGSLSTGTLGANVCVFEFGGIAVPDVPFYSIEVGRRGALTYSFAEMTAKGWTVSLSLG